MTNSIPLYIKSKRNTLLPAEGVYAVFEVKPDFKGNIDGDNFIEYTGL